MKKDGVPGEGQSNFKPAWQNGWAYTIVFFVAGLGLFLDVLTKRWACHTIGDPINGYIREPVVIIPDHLFFCTQFNSGAVWSLASGQRIFLLTMSVVALIFLGWLFFSLKSKQRLSQAAVGMLVAGALGNLHDRLFNDGYVIDFIEVNLGFWPANPWPIFNVADMLLCVGVGFLLLGLLKSSRRPSAGH